MVHEVRLVIVAPAAVEARTQLVLTGEELVITDAVHIGRHQCGQPRLRAEVVVKALKAEDEAMRTLGVAQRREEAILRILGVAPLVAARVEAPSIDIEPAC